MIIITGGAGFIGSALISQLNTQGCDDIVVVDNLSNTDKWKNLVGKNFVEYLHKDDFLKQIVGNTFKHKVTALVHLGACSSTTEMNLNYLMENNYWYSINCAKWALSNGARFIYASSAATYGDGSNGYKDDSNKLLELRPLNGYGFSKYLFDAWVIHNKLFDSMVGLKFFNVYGPNEYHKDNMTSVILKSFNQIKSVGKVKLFRSHRPDYKDGEQMRDFIYVKDCTKVISWLIDNKNTNGIYNLGTGKARTWNALVESVFKAMNINPNIEYFEMPLDMQSRYQYYTEADMNKLKSTNCPIEFSSLEDGVSDYVNGYLEKGFAYL